MNLTKDLLAKPWIGCRHFLLIEGIQGRVAVESHVESIGRNLVAGEQGGIVGVIIPIFLKLGNVIPARYCTCGRRGLPRGQELSKERFCRVVLYVELDADRLEVALQDRFRSAAPGTVGGRCVLELQ